MTYTMKTPEEIEKVYEAVKAADPNQDDEAMSMLYDTLRFVLGYSKESPEKFIEDYVEF